MFTTPQDFDYQPYNLPNLEKKVAAFEAFREDYEAAILKEILGVELYNEFIDALEEDYPEDKWTDLRDGALYQEGEISYEWKGLIGKTGALVPYIYAMWTLFSARNNSGVGITMPKSENSYAVSPANEVSGPYAQFISMIGRKCRGEKKNTLYGFLKANEADYPNLVWTDLGSINSFDL